MGTTRRRVDLKEKLKLPSPSTKPRTNSLSKGIAEGEFSPFSVFPLGEEAKGQEFIKISSEIAGKILNLFFRFVKISCLLSNVRFDVLCVK